MQYSNSSKSYPQSYDLRILPWPSVLLRSRTAKICDPAPTMGSLHSSVPAGGCDLLLPTCSLHVSVLGVVFFVTSVTHISAELRIVLDLALTEVGGV